MSKKLQEWTEICEKFCKDRNYKILFVKPDSFGFEDDKGKLHHLYAEELMAVLLKVKVI